MTSTPGAPIGGTTVRSRVADAVGCAVFLALAVKVIVESPTFGILVVPVIVQDVLVALLFVIRRPAAATLPGWIPKAAAFAGSFLVLVFAEVGRRWYPEWLAMTMDTTQRTIGQAIWVIGMAIALWSLWYLRRAFSIVPQARELVTRGPYRLARHPMYIGYIVMNFGIWLQFPTLATGIAMAAWLALTAARIRFEEIAVSRAFPEYESYRRRVGPLWPRL